jgi:hypothetical protein
MILQNISDDEIVNQGDAIYKNNNIKINDKSK